ncbi:MAG: hypothetical protein QXT27_01490 [Pyrobaculum sp.]
MVINWVLERAYVPEHLPHYFTSMSDADVYISGGYVYYKTPHAVVVVAYPLEGGWEPSEVYRLVEQFLDRVVVVIGPDLPPLSYVETSQDFYYRLMLPAAVSKKLRYMVRRASREVSISISRRVGREHLRLVESFLKARDVSYIRAIYRRLPQYVASHPEVYVLEALDRRGAIVGFDVVDFSAARFGFYMFNFIDRVNYVPGVSDYLFYNFLKLAEAKNKRELNLGLGSTEGVRKFKEKWGGAPWLPYRYGLYISASVLFNPMG